jgi:hypothetical protein
MNLEQAEKNLAIKVIIFAVVVYGLVWGSNRYIAEFTNAERAANDEYKATLQDFQERLGQIQVEEQLQSQYVNEYNQFQSSGRIVSDQEIAQASENEELRRLELLSRLQDIINEREFFEAQYTLSSPENLPSETSEIISESTVLIRATRMDIEMPLLHSLDILMLINDFYDEQTNRFVPVDCEMTLMNNRFRSEDAQERRLALFEVTENIEAKCGLVWLSIYDPALGKSQEELEESA